MENYTIPICIVILISFLLTFFYEDSIYKSHKISPVSGMSTKITVCMHDPYFNNGFIVSLSSYDELKEIQKSLKLADKNYIIRKDSGNYYLINNRHKREQIIKECSYKTIQNLMKKNKTSLVDYSV